MRNQRTRENAKLVVLKCVRTIGCLLGAIALLTPPAFANGTVATQTSSFRLDKDRKVKALEFPPLVLAHPDPSLPAQLRLHGLVDQVSPLLGSGPRRSGRIRVVVRCEGVRSTVLAKRRPKLDANGNFVLSVSVPRNKCDLVNVAVEGSAGNQTVDAGSEITVSTSLSVRRPATPTACQAGGVLCLQDGRFQARLDWTDFEARQGNGFALQRSVHSGTFLFLDPENLSLFLRILDGCSTNGAYWVFAAADTTIRYSLTITDTETGATQTFSNPERNASAAIVEYQAFTTCP